jgi:Mg2+/Co2+ transporter CorC
MSDDIKLTYRNWLETSNIDELFFECAEKSENKFHISINDNKDIIIIFKIKDLYKYGEITEVVFDIKSDCVVVEICDNERYISKEFECDKYEMSVILFEYYMGVIL